MVRLLWKIVWQFSKKLHIPLSHGSPILASSYLPKRKENVCLYKDVDMKVPCIVLRKSQKLETTQMFLRWKDTHCSMTMSVLKLHRNKMEWTIDSCNYLDNLSITMLHERRKAKNKSMYYTVRVHIFENMENANDAIVSESKSVVAWGWEGWEGKTTKGHEKHLEVVDVFIILTVAMVSQRRVLKLMKWDTLKCTVYWVWVIPP